MDPTIPNAMRNISKISIRFPAVVGQSASRQVGAKGPLGGEPVTRTIEGRLFLNRELVELGLAWLGFTSSTATTNDSQTPRNNARLKKLGLGGAVTSRLHRGTGGS